MELNNANGAHVQNGTAAETISKAATNGAAKHPIANGKPTAEKPKPIPAKDEKPEIKQEPKVEESKAEINLAKSELSLDGKLKVVADLHRRSVQRLNLISRLKQIEAFEVALAQESDELEDNPYQGCKLIIEDDKQRRFVTTTPGLIRLVSQFIFSACHEKLAEIEAAIVFPNA